MFCPPTNSEEFVYIDKHISTDRYYYLWELNTLSGYDLSIAFRDIDTNMWTKWTLFNKTSLESLRNNYDVQRSLLYNEIIIEGDDKDYSVNALNMRKLGAIIEGKGFIPHYYYSGGKSIHCHVFLDFKSLLEIDGVTQEIIVTTYSKGRFVKEFISFLRTKMSTGWGINFCKFDRGFDKSATHLIRAELSRNSLGYKTFLGYSWKDIPLVQPICNSKSKIGPVLGKVLLSAPPARELQLIVDEWLEFSNAKEHKKRLDNRITLLSWVDNGVPNNELRPCVRKLMCHPELYSDGQNRAMFIIFNELREKDPDNAVARINAWNNALPEPVKQCEIEYRANRKVYALSCNYIHSFMREIGFDDKDINH